MNSTTSENSRAISAVPQFWVPSCFLFLVYTDVANKGLFSLGTCIILYEDDILLYRTISSNLDYSYLQSDANTAWDWVNCNHMFLNPSKCKFMLISRKRNKMNNTVTINGQILETVHTFRYSGLSCCSYLTCLGQNTLKEYAPKQRKSRAFYTTNTLTRRLFANCIYPLYGPTWSM